MARRSLCQTNSPRQNEASSSEKKLQKPEGVKMGWCHHSEKGFGVQSSSRILSAEPVKSPNASFVRNAHAAIGTKEQARKAAPHRTTSFLFWAPRNSRSSFVS